MLRSRIPPSRFRPCFTGTRAFSDTRKSYPSKVRAFPFVVSKEEAIADLSLYAALCDPFKATLPALAARLLPGLGWNTIKPERIQPVYLPAWLVDAEVEVQSWNRVGEETQKRAATLHLTNSYFPGLLQQPLSDIPFNVESLFDLESVPFTEDLKVQHGSQILCIPFSASPVVLPQAAKQLSVSNATVATHLRFDPHTLKPNVMAAYPILVPLYLAEYRVLGQEDVTVSFVLEAFERKGRIIQEIEQMVTAFNTIFARGQTSVPKWLQMDEFIDNQRFIEFRGPRAPFARVELFLSPQSRPTLAKELGWWLNDAAPRCLRALERQQAIDPKTARVDFGHPWVREYEEDEIKAVRKYMALGVEISAIQHMLDTVQKGLRGGDVKILSFNVDSDKEDKTDGKDANAKQKAMKLGPLSFTAEAPDDFAKAITGSLEMLKRKRSESKPAWWKQWEGESADS